MSEYHLKAAIFDWAGTMVDHGSQAPMGVFVKAFAEFGIEITIEEARGPMGMAKRDHIRTLLEIPHIAEAWRTKHGGEVDDAAIDRVYDVFVPMNVAVAGDFADLIEGAAETAARIRARGMKIGSCTGYTREIMAPVLVKAKAQGYEPDTVVCTGDVPAGRPSPLMLYKVFTDLGVWPAWRTVKIDDTEVGIEEGLNAGAWTVGVAMTGNVFGLNQAETDALDDDALEAMRTAAYGKLLRSGAHFVIDGVADLMPVLDEIEGAIARGERP